MKKWAVMAVLSGAALAQSPLPPTQRVLFENDLVRVLDIRYAPGVAEAVHSHPRGVTIALSDYDNETKSVPDGKKGGGHTPFGQVRWAEPVTHEARNTGKTEQHVIRIELKKDTPSAPGAWKPDSIDALLVSKDSQKLLFENAWVRVIEDRGPAGNFAPKHSHQRGLLVILADYDAEIKTFPGGAVTAQHFKKGEVRWSEPAVHEVRNVGKSPTYAVRIEVK
jgi:hypothetical protein